MINEFYETVNLLEKLNKTLKLKISTPKEMAELKRNMVHLQNDITQLKGIIKKYQNDEISSTTSLSHTYMYYGNIIQDLQDIQEIIILAMKRYSKHLEDE